MQDVTKRDETAVQLVKYILYNHPDQKGENFSAIIKITIYKIPLINLSLF